MNNKQISVLIFHVFTTYRSVFRQVLCTDAIDVRQFIKSRVCLIDELLWYTSTRVLEPFYTSPTLSTIACINRPWQQSEWPISFCGPTQESASTAPNAKKIWGEVWEEMKLNGWGRYKLERKHFLVVGGACMAIFWPTPGRKGEPLGALLLDIRGCSLNLWVCSERPANRRKGHMSYDAVFVPIGISWTRKCTREIRW